MTDRTERIESLDLLRGLCAIGVACYHVLSWVQLATIHNLGLYGVYVFFLDCTGHVAEPRLGEALQGLRRICAEVRFLGSYPRHRWSKAAAEEPAPSQPGLTNADFADSAAWLTRLRSGELN